jgi:hypothetical protein
MRKFLVLVVTVITALSVAGCASWGGKSPFGKGKGKSPIVHTKG